MTRDDMANSKAKPQSNDKAATEDMVQIGFIRGAHALKGHVAVHIFSDNEDALTEYGPVFNDDQSHVFEFTVTGDKGADFLCLVNDVRDRNGAEALRGTKLYVAASALPELDEDEFYIKDLIGLTILDQNGTVLGKIRHVEDFVHHDALDIEFIHDGTNPLESKRYEYLLFTRENVPELNLAAGTVTVNLPIGFFDKPEKTE